MPTETNCFIVNKQFKSFSILYMKQWLKKKGKTNVQMKLGVKQTSILTIISFHHNSRAARARRIPELVKFYIVQPE